MQSRRKFLRPTNRNLSRSRFLRLEQLEERAVFNADTWAVTLGGTGNDVPSAIAATLDGGYVVAGTTTSFNANNTDIWLTRFGSDGTLLWTKTYGGNFYVQLTEAPNDSYQYFTYDYAKDVAELASGNIVVTGISQYAPGNASEGMRIEVDANGNLVDVNLHSFGRFPSDKLSGITENGNTLVGDLTLTIHNYNNGNVNFSNYVTFADINGQMYGDPHLGVPFQLKRATNDFDGFSAIGQYGFTNGAKTFVYNGSANMTYNWGSDETGAAIAYGPPAGQNNDYLAITSQNIPFSQATAVRTLVRKVDADTLLPIWERSFYNTVPGEVVTTGDGGMLVAMYSSTFELSSLEDTGSGSHVVLAKLSAAGDLEWAKSYGGRKNEGTDGAGNYAGEIIGLVRVSNGYAFSFSTRSFGADENTELDNSQYFVVKTDLDGNVEGISGIMRDVTTVLNGAMESIGSTVESVSFEPINPSGYQYLPENDPDFYYFPVVPNIPYSGGIITDVVETSVGVVPKDLTDGTYSAGTIQFSAASGDATENNLGFTNGVVQVERVGGSYGYAKFGLTQTPMGGATGSDATIYVDSQSPLEFYPGETSLNVNVYAATDDYDPGEFVRLELSDPDPKNGATVGAQSTTDINLINVDPQPMPGTVQLKTTNYVVNEGDQYFYIELERTDGFDGQVTVDVSITPNGTATLGTDYTINTVTAYFSGATASVYVQLSDDLEVEGTESFSFQLTNVTGGATIGANNSGTVTINDNDVVQNHGEISLVPGSLTVDENAGTYSIQVQRVNGSDGYVQFAFNTSSLTATAGDDFESVSQTLYFYAGETGPQTVTFEILDDNLAEGNEKFRIALSNPEFGATLGQTTQVDVTIKDIEAPTLALALSTPFPKIVVGDTVSLTLTAADPTGPANPKFHYEVNWGDGDVSLLDDAPASKVLTHQYQEGGNFTITATATNSRGEVSATATKQAKVLYAVQVGKSLQIYGSDFLDDSVTIFPKNAVGTQVQVFVNNTDQGTFSGLNEIQVHLGAGNDTVVMGLNGKIKTTIPAFVFAGAGNDTINIGGSGAANVVIGSDGNDTIFGGYGRDILIGGKGMDTIRGGSGDDVLIGGQTAWDTSLPALRTLISQWKGTATYAKRIGVMTTGANPNLAAPKVVDDAAADALYGDAGMDWFLGHTLGTKKDKIVRVTKPVAEKLTVI